VSVVFILLIASLAVATGFLAAFFWAVRSGQFEDTATPAMRVLGEDDMPPDGGEARGERKEQG
jgi:cbb3-type cytochrome oxidase maturation protein